MLDYILSDLMRHYGKTDWLTLVKAILTNRLYRFQFVFRLTHGKGLIKFIGLVLWMLNRTRKTIILPRRTKVGYGLYIGHFAPIVINSTAVIGNNVNISQFVTIGSNFGKAATIGDNVYIGPNVCVVEDVKIGNNVSIGAGGVVTKDIPNNATAVGNYARVINYNNPARFIKNRWVCRK